VVLPQAGLPGKVLLQQAGLPGKVVLQQAGLPGKVLLQQAGLPGRFGRGHALFGQCQHRRKPEYLRIGNSSF
jgi:hypothetical protein